MKTTVKMALVKPAVNGLEADSPLYTEPEYVGLMYYESITILSFMYIIICHTLSYLSAFSSFL